MATKAIDLAAESDARLTFVNVIEAEFLGSATPTLSSLGMVYQKLRQVSEFA